MRISILVLLVSLVSGCATTGKYQANCESWLNKSDKELIQAWGIPRNSYEIDSSTKMLEFIFDGGTVYNGDYLSMVAGGQERVVNDCRTTFTIKNGSVYAYRFEGRACRSK